MTPTLRTEFTGRTAVITGAASGFGLETARLAARQGMNVVMTDVMAEALEAAGRDVAALGGTVMTHRADVRHADAIEGLAAATCARFGTPHLVFNNAGVSTGGLVWEHTEKEWDWVLGVNLRGVVHGVRVFTPLMLAAERADPAFRGHIVNTASMAGLLNAPNMGAYCARISCRPASSTATGPGRPMRGPTRRPPRASRSRSASARRPSPAARSPRPRSRRRCSTRSPRATSTSTAIRRRWRR